MAEHLTEPAATAATTVVTASKLATIGSATIAGSAGYFGDHFFAWAGLIATVLFGALGTFISLYFKHKEYKIKERADLREYESHVMLQREHEATMARLSR